MKTAGKAAINTNISKLVRELLRELVHEPFHWLFRETVVPHMHINKHGLSRHSIKTSKQSTSITLSLAKAFFNDTND